MAAPLINVRHAGDAEIEFVNHCLTAQREEMRLQVGATGKRRHDWTCSQSALSTAIANDEVLVAELENGT
jgi:hypothetical protein